MSSVLVLLVVPACLRVSALPEHQCRHGTPWGGNGVVEWIEDEALMRDTLETTWNTPNRETVNLDLAPEERWVSIGEKYANQSYKIIEYFEEFLPQEVLQLLVKLAEKSVIANYTGFGDYAKEMQGYATGLNISLGYVVMANLVYQLEHIGVNCQNWNTTGPTNECWYSRTQKKRGPPGLCTSVVADDAENRIFHARNLDWNLEEDIKSLIIDVDFYKNGTYLYTGTSIVSFVGILNAMSPEKFSYSMDARCQGGHLLVNLFEAIEKGAATPTQHARHAFDNADTITNFDNFIDTMSSGDLVNDAYFILGGISNDEGAVVTRARNQAIDVWRIGDSTDSTRDWYRLETNYDHWLSPPSSDDRRTPGMAHMDNLTQSGVTINALFDDILSAWPTLNPHTDISCVMAAFNSTYECRVWSESSSSLPVPFSATTA